MGTVTLPKAVGEGRAVWREDRRQDPHHGPLDERGLTAGLPYRPLLPPCLLDPSPFDRQRDLPMVTAPLMQGAEGGGQGLSLLRGRHLVHAWRTGLPGEARGCPKKLPVKQVQHVVAPPRRIALGLFGHPLEFHGDGW